MTDEEASAATDESECVLYLLKDLQTRFEGIDEKITNKTEELGLESTEKDGEDAMDIILSVSEVVARLVSHISSTTKNAKRLQEREKQSCEKTDAVQELLEKLVNLEVVRSKEKGTPENYVHLPKLDFAPFSGDVLMWGQFWDTFSAAIDSNPNLKPVQKLTYLLNKLHGDAKVVVGGFLTTNENYPIVVELLHQRFGDKQVAITAHYSKIMELRAAPNSTKKLRILHDELEQHLRCLSALGEDVNHRHFISLIMTKLPKSVIVRLEELKGTQEPWTVILLRSKLECHLTARENGKRQSKELSSNSSPLPFTSRNARRSGCYSRHSQSSSQTSRDSSEDHPDRRRSTAEALYAHDNHNGKEKAYPRCVFCKNMHWSDECKEFVTVSARKKQIFGRCFNCLSKDHVITKCPSTRACWYCKKIQSHHRSICPDQFQKDKECCRLANEPSGELTDESLLARGECALLQTAMVKAVCPGSKYVINLRLLFDSGSHRSYISADAARKLHLQVKGSETIKVNTFGETTCKPIATRIVEFRLLTLDNNPVSVVTNMIPQISGSVRRQPIDLSNYNAILKDLQLAEPVPTAVESTTIDVLIGSDYYLDFLTFEKIPLGDGIHLLGSKFGWILTGRYPKKADVQPDFSMLVLDDEEYSYASKKGRSLSVLLDYAKQTARECRGDTAKPKAKYLSLKTTMKFHTFYFVAKERS